jgi:hypothetical protein
MPTKYRDYAGMFPNYQAVGNAKAQSYQNNANTVGQLLQALSAIAQKNQETSQGQDLFRGAVGNSTTPQYNVNTDLLGKPMQQQTFGGSQNYIDQTGMRELIASGNPVAQKMFGNFLTAEEAQRPKFEQLDPTKDRTQVNPLAQGYGQMVQGRPEQVIPKAQYQSRNVVDENGQPKIVEVNGIKFAVKEKYDPTSNTAVPNSTEFAKVDDSTYSPNSRISAEFNQESSLRKEFGSKPIVKDYNDLKSKYLVAKEAYQKARTSGNASAADQALITMFNKMTDPQSVVRESEYSRTPQNVALVNRAQGAFDKLSTGGSGITNADRKAILDMAELAFGAYKGLYEKEKQRYTNIAKSKRIDPKLIVDEEDVASPSAKPKSADPLGIR